MRFVVGCCCGDRTRDSRISLPPARRVGDDGALDRSVEGSNMVGERRGWSSVCCLVVVGEKAPGAASRKMSRPGAAGGGSKGIVLSVLVLVRRRKRGPFGLLEVGDCRGGDGGGSDALDGYARYGCTGVFVVTDTRRERKFPVVELGLVPYAAGRGARMSPWDWTGRCPSITLPRRCDCSRLSPKRSWALCRLVGNAWPIDARDAENGSGTVTNGSFIVGGPTFVAR